MKNSTVRWVIVLATLSIAGITVTQLYWLRRAFDLKEAEFERTISTALFNVAQQLFEISHTPSPSNNPVQQVSTNYFVVTVNSEIDANLLEFLLRTEFEKRNVQTDFEYGIYDCTNEKMVYGNYVPLQASPPKEPTKSLPKWSSPGYYFGVQFPYREATILNQMGIWVFSSIVLLMVIIFFCYTLFIILKQRRLSVVQKDFINNITHEFKTPISTIAVSTEVLKEPDILHSPERLLNYTTIIEKENNRLKQQVERVLQMARYDKDEIALKLEKTGIQQIIQEAVQYAAAALEEKEGTIEVEPGAANPEILADQLHMANALYNIIDNAIKYCSGTPHIVIRMKDDPKKIRLFIEDNAIGIEEAHRRRVFQKFYRVPTGNLHDVKGFGLGLSYVKSIVEAHKGKILLASTPGKGSVFEIRLPKKTGA